MIGQNSRSEPQKLDIVKIYFKKGYEKLVVSRIKAENIYLNNETLRKTTLEFAWKKSMLSFCWEYAKRW